MTSDTPNTTTCSACDGHGELFVNPPLDNSSHLWGIAPCPVCTDTNLSKEVEYLQTYTQAPNDEQYEQFSEQEKYTRLEFYRRFHPEWNCATVMLEDGSLYELAAGDTLLGPKRNTTRPADLGLAVFEVVDVVTDAISLQITDVVTDDDDTTLPGTPADCPVQDFRKDTRDGLYIPAEVLTDDAEETNAAAFSRLESYRRDTDLAAL